MNVKYNFILFKKANSVALRFQKKRKIDSGHQCPHGKTANTTMGFYDKVF